MLTVLIITITFKKFSNQILTPSSSMTNVTVSTAYAKFWTSYNFNSSIIHPHSSSHYDFSISMLQSFENISIILVSALPFMWFQTLRHHVEDWNLQLNIKIKKNNVNIKVKWRMNSKIYSQFVIFSLINLKITRWFNFSKKVF